MKKQNSSGSSGREKTNPGTNIMQPGIWILLLGLGAVGGYAAGYRLHPENLSYYIDFLKADPNGGEQIFELRSGATFTGTVLRETPESFQVRTSSGSMIVSKTQVISTKTAPAQNPWQVLLKKISQNQSTHPLIRRETGRS